MAGDEPAGGVVIAGCGAWGGAGCGLYRELEALQGGGEVDEALLLEGADPLAVIDKGGVDATIALGGAGNALVGGKESAGAVFSVTHGAVEDGAVFFIDGRVVHVKGHEDPIFYKAGVGLVGGAFDDECQQAEAGVAIAEPGAG